MEKHEIVVLGAGAAGLAAALRLTEAGKRPLVLEARDRIGGRVHTVQGPAGPLELGAEWIHGRPKELWGAAVESGLELAETSDVHWRRRGRRLGEEEGFWERQETVFKRLRSRGPDSTFDEFARRERIAPALAAEVRAFVEGFHAADASAISEIALARLVKTAGDTEEERSFRVVPGYRALLDGWARRLRRGALRLNAPVKTARWRRGGAEIVLRSGRRIAARRVIVTLPVGVLKASPDLLDPAPKAAALARLHMGPVRKALMTFRPRAWEEMGLGRPGFLHDDGLTPNVFWTQAPLQRPVITAWAGGPRALLPGDFRRDSLRSLERVLGKRRLERGLVDFRFHDWQADPWARGAYSWVSAGGADAHLALARPIDGTLFFAGEATDAEGQNGTVQGALASGRRAAAEVLSSRA